MDLQEIGEFGLINRIRRWATSSDPALVQGIGDDVAVIGKGLTALLVTTDILIEDIHFDLSWTDPYTLGRKSLAVNLSDIASMGGTPKYFLISIGLPKNLPLSFVSSFYQGLKKEAKRYQVELIGGGHLPFSKNRHQHLPSRGGKKKGPPLQKRSKVG